MTLPAKNPWLHRIDDAEISYMTQQLIASNHLNPDTPWLVVYNTRLLRQRLRYLKHHFPSDSIHTLAIKACPLIAVLQIALDEGFGLEAASLEEVHLAIKAGAKGKHIVFDSPVKTQHELRFALNHGIHINVDNFTELERINQLITPQNTAHIGLRINPEVGKGSIAMTSVADISSKFGLSLSNHRDAIIDCFKQYNWLNGLHIHVGSQGCSLDMLLSAAHNIDGLKNDINNATQSKRIQWVDIGGGLPAHYGFKTQGIDIQLYVSQLKKIAPGLFEQPLLSENGRSILANCAWAVSRIEYIKPQHNSITASIHFGADFMLRPVYAAKDWPHEYLVLNQDGGINQAQKVTLNIAGPLCFSGDYLAQNIALPQPDNNSLIVAKDVGAYTLGTWSRHCNRRLPKVVAYDDVHVSTLFKGESFEDVVNFWS